MPRTHEPMSFPDEKIGGDERALDQLTPLVYKELRKLAAGYLRNEQCGYTLQPTSLVHEVYLRLVNRRNSTIENRSYFFAIAARLMRQVLVDHARRRKAAKRRSVKVALEMAANLPHEQDADLLVLNRALNALENFDPRKCKAIELKYFGGLSTDEIAEVLSVSSVTVRRDLRIAEAWLQNELQDA
jgi:RNA polymerase sigma factor (TIGR02999 family)